jgi:hypothetical protein
MPDLVEGPSPLRVEFAVSLPHSLLATISLMCAAAKFEGLGDWLQETRSRLAAELCDELCTLVGFPGRYERFNGELFARLPAHAMYTTFDDLMASLRSIGQSHHAAAIPHGAPRSARPACRVGRLPDRCRIGGGA